MRSVSIFIICGMCLSLAQLPGQIAEAEDDTSHLPAPVAVFKKHCYDANRLHRRAKRPEVGSDWVVVPESMRERLDIADDPEINAYIHTRMPENEMMMLQVSEHVLKDVPRNMRYIRGLRHNSCRIIYTGSEKFNDIHDALVKVMDRVPGEDKAGIANDCGYTKPGGWRQWLWMAMPKNDSKAWNIYKAPHGKSTCIIFTERRDFYLKDLIAIQFLAQETGGAFIIHFDRTFSDKE